MATHDRRHRGGNGGRRDAGGHLDPFHQRRKRYETVLRPMGLWDAFAALPRKMQELFWKLKLPDPVVAFEDDAAAAVPPGMRAAAERYLRDASITVKCGDDDDGGHKVAVRDFIGVVIGMLQFCQAWNSGLIPKGRGPFPEILEPFIRQATPVLEQWQTGHLQAAWDAMYAAVMFALVQGSRIDTRLFTARLDAAPNERGRCETRVIVSTSPPHMKHVELDGRLRPAYRVGRIGRGTREVDWVSWDDAARPVYVQAHALRRLRERVRMPYVEPWLDSWLAESMVSPNIVERQGADLLVEFRLKQWRLGYLVVTPSRDEDGRDCLVARTFKLLTMDNMPEARRLARRLKLTTVDVNWLRLHELESFTHTDLRTDPLLRRLMEECGCGHLFQLAEERNFAPQPKPLAAEVRKYLRLAA